MKRSTLCFNLILSNYLIAFIEEMQILSEVLILDLLAKIAGDELH